MSFFRRFIPGSQSNTAKEEVKEIPITPEEALSRELKAMDCKDTINLSGRGIKELPQGLLHHKGTLEGLILSRNDAPKISLIADFQKLKRLDLSQCNLEEIENEVFLLKYLESLNVNHNNLTAINDLISNLHYLTDFNGSNNKITMITTWIGHAISMKTLNLSYNVVNIGNNSNFKTFISLHLF